MPTYRKKPVEIEAMRLVPGTDSYKDVLDWITSSAPGTKKGYDGESKGIFIQTLEGEMIASPGDWIIRGVKGEFYPCRSDIFEVTYERVSVDDPLSQVPDGEAP